MQEFKIGWLSAVLYMKMLNAWKPLLSSSHLSTTLQKMSQYMILDIAELCYLLVSKFENRFLPLARMQTVRPVYYTLKVVKHISTYAFDSYSNVYDALLYVRALCLTYCITLS